VLHRLFSVDGEHDWLLRANTAARIPAQPRGEMPIAHSHCRRTTPVAAATFYVTRDTKVKVKPVMKVELQI
jgi:hypothetical protein